MPLKSIKSLRIQDITKLTLWNFFQKYIDFSIQYLYVFILIISLLVYSLPFLCILTLREFCMNLSSLWGYLVLVTYSVICRLHNFPCFSLMILLTRLDWSHHKVICSFIVPKDPLSMNLPSKMAELIAPETDANYQQVPISLGFVLKDTWSGKYMNKQIIIWLILPALRIAKKYFTFFIIFV